MKRLKSVRHIIIPVFLFLCATLPNLTLPGIQYDELYYAPPAAALLKGQHDMDYVKLDPSVISVGGKPIPLMFNYYTSFLRSYLTFPLFALMGIGVETVRLSSILFGTVALGFFAMFTRRLTGSPGVALLAGTFLAVDASFVGYTHNDYVAVSTMMLWKGIALWALLRWWQGDGVRWLALGLFFIGLGVTDRVSFLWIPISLGAAFLLVERKNAWDVLKKRWPGLSGVFLCIASGLLGGSIFFAFNIATLGGSFLPMAENFRQTSGGVDNLDLFSTLHLRLMMLSDLLSGGYLTHFILGENSYVTKEWMFSGSPLSWLALLSFLFYAEKIIRGMLRGNGGNRVALFLVAMSSCIVILTCFTPTIHRGHQLLMLYPFPHILIAMFLYDIHRLMAMSGGHLVRTMSRWLSPIVLGLLLLLTGERVVAYHEMLQETGGRGVWSDAIYEIVAEADRNPGKIYVCMDWGFNANILSLTKNRVQTVRSYETSRRTAEEVAKLFDDKHRFLVHAEGSVYMTGGGELLREAAGKSDATVDTTRTFFHRSGDPAAYLLRIVK